MNDGKPHLDEEGVFGGVALRDNGEERAGMGVAVGDYKLDGRLDIFKTHFFDDTNILYRNDGGANFTDVNFGARSGVETRFTCWGTGMVDLDNSGWPDIFVVTGACIRKWEKGAGLPLQDTPDRVSRSG